MASSDLRTRAVLAPSMLALIGLVYWLDHDRVLFDKQGALSAFVLGALGIVGAIEYCAMLRKAGFAVSRGLLRPDGLVLSSPALAVDMAAWQRAAVSWLPRLAPNLTLGNSVKPQFLSHDPAVVAAYQADPLVHDRICARLGAFVAQEGEQVCAAAARWSVPTLLLYAGDDRLVSPRGSRAFAATAEAARAPLQSRCFGTLYHEIFNEPEPSDPGDSPFRALATWLDARG